MGSLDLDENTNLHIDILKGYVEEYHAKYNYNNFEYKWCDECCNWPGEDDLIYRPALNTRYIYISYSYHDGVIYLAVNKLSLNTFNDTDIWWFHVNIGDSNLIRVTLEDVINEMGPQ